MGVFGFERRRAERLPGASVVPPPRSMSPGTPTPEQALTIAAVYRSVSLLTTAVSQLPLEVHRGNDPVASRLAQRPDIHQTLPEFLQETVFALATTGNCYWWKTLNTDGTVMNVQVVNPSKVSVTAENPNDIVPQPRYEIDSRRVNPYITHLRLATRPGEFIGFGPIQAAGRDLRIALLLREYTEGYFNTGSPVGILSSDAVLTQDQSDMYRDAWAENMSKRSVAVLGAGLSYTPVYQDSQQAQLVDNQRAITTNIARLFGIPPQLLASGIEGSSLTYTTTESLWQTFLQTTLAQYLSAIEANFSDLLPRGQEARFKLDALLRSNLSARVEAYTAFTAMGVMDAEEVRLSEGMSAGAPGPTSNPQTAPQTATNGSPT